MYQFKIYKATELMNKFSNKCWTKDSINRLLKTLRDTGTRSTDWQAAADHEVPH